MKVRAGITLIEVLVAIFIMSIGMLALMTLFPLGALSMAEALRADRCDQAGRQANAVTNAMNVRTDSNAALQAAFSNNGTNTLPAYWTGPSFPVFVDPWGMYIGASGNVGSTGPVLRTNLSFTAGSLTNTMRYCGLQDELTFLNNGTPDTSSGLERIPLTTWAYWLRRPNNSQPNVVELSIVVYYNRNLQLGSAETLVTNIAPNAATDPTTIVVPATTDIRRNQWIVDVTANYPTTGQTANARSYGPVQGNWYRVTNVVDTPLVANGVALDLQPKAAAPIQQFVIMEDVVEVFYKGTGWK
jgi:hypothetical protein